MRYLPAIVIFGIMIGLFSALMFDMYQTTLRMQSCVSHGKTWVNRDNWSNVMECR